nr:MAG TPA: hypothetical protein [Caudoviricetes sp.]
MISIAYESFVNDICIDIANESINYKIKSGWNKVIKFWDSVIKFIHKKINEFITFIKNIFTKKKNESSKKDDETKSPNSNNNDDNYKKENVKVDNTAENKSVNYDQYCKISGNIYLMCVNIDHVIANLHYYMNAIKKDSSCISDINEILELADDYIGAPEKYVREPTFCTVSGNDKDHLDEDWIINKSALSTLATYLDRTKNEINNIRKDLEKFNPNNFGDNYIKIQNSIILCGKVSSKLVSKVCDIKNIISEVTKNDFDNLYHRFPKYNL